MSPGTISDSSADRADENATNGCENETSHVIVAGAGPAGLMLAYVSVLFKEIT